jgi:hypothetical protein
MCLYQMLWELLKNYIHRSTITKLSIPFGTSNHVFLQMSGFPYESYMCHQTFAKYVHTIVI